MRWRRRSAGIAGALALLSALAACATPSSTPLLSSSFSGAIARWCADTTAQGSGVIGASPERWTWTSSTTQVRGQPESPRAWIVFAPFGAASAPDVVHAHAVAACMNRVPLDWSLALDDSRATRFRLYGWYRDVLVPCLSARNVPGRLPSRAEFVESSAGRIDPYSTVGYLDPAAAARLQAQCPPAPPDVAAEARLLAPAVAG